MMTNAAPPLGPVLETGLYVADLNQARHFYESLLGLRVMFHDDRVAAYDVAAANVLLLFQRGTTDTPAQLPGGTIPPHDGTGRLHYAFSIAPEHLELWRNHLAAHDITIEGEVKWPKGGVSLYFRDPDGHLVELATPGLWANY
ncbi:catechol 2,3-dioxygenase-like lactoylglutathione lyase family enzyme [Pseudomonas duriflava]|uniref:Catechol 2,3-dioxygenase-like lactoylglutathione lyase family enzyme n=1 Tax=Pseudomonas duriflava TaxID=459528 RepID=A0A562Q6J2_9PSED|nr:VOC family protein [Pseudomonas duriflava]TWI52328.1 catechol 2,3-dioxygenase-like lactoylglutathione lyase family enzyme [Pseudomonas duriflava]